MFIHLLYPLKHIQKSIDTCGYLCTDLKSVEHWIAALAPVVTLFVDKETAMLSNQLSYIKAQHSSFFPGKYQIFPNKYLWRSPFKYCQFSRMTMTGELSNFLMDSSDQNVLSNQIAGMSVGTFCSTTQYCYCSVKTQIQV